MYVEKSPESLRSPSNPTLISCQKYYTIPKELEQELLPAKSSAYDRTTIRAMVRERSGREKREIDRLKSPLDSRTPNIRRSLHPQTRNPLTIRFKTCQCYQHEYAFARWDTKPTLSLSLPLVPLIDYVRVFQGVTDETREDLWDDDTREVDTPREKDG